ncbi:MAG: hypothetical protein HQK96_11315, partial [Nitrospirae bacterium]|nr:hypothetical protein [Nitrospirota bacterium]
MGVTKGYAVKARVALKTEKSGILTVLPFSWQLDSIASDNSSDGWVEKEGNLVWLPGGKQQLLGIPLEISKPIGGLIGMYVFPQNFQELWIDYEDIFPQDPCGMGIILNFNPTTDRTRRRDVVQANYETAIGGSNVPMHIETIDVADSDDDEWQYQYKEADNLTIIKRQFYRDISDVEQAILEFSPDTKLETVSLQMEYKDGPKPNETVIWKELPKDIKIDVRVGEDSTETIIWIGRYLRQNYPEGKVFLKELIVHLKGRVVKSRPFKTLSFRYAWNKAVLLPIFLHELPSGLKRMNLDLQEISDAFNYTSDMKAPLKTALLYVNPYSIGKKCGIQLKGITAVNSYEGRRPKILSDIVHTNDSFGGPFTNYSKDSSHLEALKFLNYHSFSSSIKNEISNRITSDTKDPIDRMSGGLDNLTSDNLTVSKEYLTDSKDVKIIKTITSHPPVSMFFNDNYLVKEAKGLAWIKILFSTNKVIEDNTYFIIKLSGGIEFVKKGLMILKTDSGEQFIRVFKPNMPLALSGIKGRITQIRIRMDLYEGPLSIKFNDMALFSPATASNVEALKIPRPSEIAVKLLPELDNKSVSVEASLGTLKGSLLRENANESLEWNTAIDNQTGMMGVSFDFENNRAVNPESPCWLTLTFIGDNQQVSRRVCKESKKGKVFIGLPYVFSAAGH